MQLSSADKACPNPWCIWEGDRRRLQVSSYMYPSVVSREQEYHVRCACGMKGPAKPTEAEAVEAWNLRPSLPGRPERPNTAGIHGDLKRILIETYNDELEVYLDSLESKLILEKS